MLCESAVWYRVPAKNTELGVFPSFSKVIQIIYTMCERTYVTNKAEKHIRTQRWRENRPIQTEKAAREKAHLSWPFVDIALADVVAQILFRVPTAAPTIRSYVN